MGDLAWGEMVVGVSGLERVVAGFDGINSAVAALETLVYKVDENIHPW